MGKDSSNKRIGWGEKEKVGTQIRLSGKSNAKKLKQLQEKKKWKIKQTTTTKNYRDKSSKEKDLQKQELNTWMSEKAEQMRFLYKAHSSTKWPI